jgi:hypothetical protein
MIKMTGLYLTNSQQNNQRLLGNNNMKLSWRLSNHIVRHS